MSYPAGVQDPAAIHVPRATRVAPGVPDKLPSDRSGSVPNFGRSSSSKRDVKAFIVAATNGRGEFVDSVRPDPHFSLVERSLQCTPVRAHVIVGLIWIAIAMTASYMPAARAARVDPSVALRDE
jgi:hypothetical protein